MGKATIEKLNDLRLSATEEGVQLPSGAIPDELNHIEKVSQMKALVELAEQNRCGGCSGGGGAALWHIPQ